MATGGPCEPATARDAYVAIGIVWSSVWSTSPSSPMTTRKRWGKVDDQSDRANCEPVRSRRTAPRRAHHAIATPWFTRRGSAIPPSAHMQWWDGGGPLR